MMHEFKYDFTILEGVTPYERTIYLNMLSEQLEKEAQRKSNGRQ